MRDTSRLTVSYDFRNVYQNGRVVYDKRVVLHVLGRPDTDNKINRVAFVVKKKIGLATARNRIKRLMREAYRANEEKVKRPHDLIFVARQPLKGKPYAEVENALRGALEKAGLLEDK